MPWRKVILVILDGWGLSEEQEWNAVFHARTPTFDRLWNEYPSTRLVASGEEVGLPSGQMGNSEVGHLNLGAGRIVETGLYRINKSIERGDFFHNPSISQLFGELKADVGSNLHILILASRGGVHSHLSHFYAFLKCTHKAGIKPIVHLFSDGRDVLPTQFIEDLGEILENLKHFEALLGTISGRYYAMDRDKNWERVERVLKVLVAEGEMESFSDPIEYIKSQYEEGITDEFIRPAASKEYIMSEKKLKKGDKVVFLNFRPDRAKELSHLLVNSAGLYDYFSQLTPPELSLYSMMDYEGIALTSVLFPRENIVNTLGEMLNKEGKTQLRAAESEKYPHVTYFFDGGVELKLDKVEKIIVQSPRIGRYEKVPEMSIFELMDVVERSLSAQARDFVVINFANPDMVGHSGSFEATVKACEAVDKALSRLYELAMRELYILVVVGDHGNADKMKESDGTPHTSHTTALVPFILCDKRVSGLRPTGKLGDVAPTILNLFSISKPMEMDGENLITF